MKTTDTLHSGLRRVRPDHRDYSVLHTFGALDPDGLPVAFSIYDGRAIPNQNDTDNRLGFTIPPLPMGCTGETGAFETGIQDAKVYNPQDLYLNTPPGNPYTGRDMREMLSVLIDRGVKDADGRLSSKRAAYFNVYGSGKIDDFDAARIALWINQQEKRGVYVGTWWYWGASPFATLDTPSYDTDEASLHCYLITGWKGDSLEVIPWLGQDRGNRGLFYVSREIYNRLMAQPWTAAFTITKELGTSPVPIGYQAIIDHLVYFVRNLFGV